jgi:hypothetical protein
MVVDLAVAENDPPLRVPVRRRRRRGWVGGALALLLFGAALGFVAGNEEQADTQFGQAQHSLLLTRDNTHWVVGDLDAVRHDLGVTKGQISGSAAALRQDVAQLTAAQGALAGAKATVWDQASVIGDLQTCVGGVEQALNALAVADQQRAIGALDEVSSSCHQVVAANG